jgi:hypothetical protein
MIDRAVAARGALSFVLAVFVERHLRHGSILSVPKRDSVKRLK